MFKALLFLCAGAIIHTIGSNEMSAMGGLRRYMPWTHITFLFACLAISGIPPFSGFFSKDEILAAAFMYSSWMGIWMSGVAGLTAFYMFRLYYNIFWGKEAVREHTPHEAPFSMTIPLMFLAVVTLCAGFIPFGKFVSSNGAGYIIHLDWKVALVSVLIACIAIGLARRLYCKGTSAIPGRLATDFGWFYRAATHRFYLDEVYLFITKRIIFAGVSRGIAWFDRHIIDGTMNLMAYVTQQVAFSIRTFQSGQVQQYAFVFLLGTLIMVLVLVL